MSCVRSLLLCSLFALSCVAFVGCGGSNEPTVAAPPDTPPSLVPEGVSEAEYAKAMKEATGH